MADSDQGNKIPNKPGDNKINMELRLMLTFVLMGVVLFLTQYLYKPPIAPKPVKQMEAPKPAQESKAPPAAANVAAAQSTAAAQTPAQPAAEQIAAAKEELFTVDTQLYHVVFSNHGAVVRNWELKNYKDEKGKPVDLVNKVAAEKVNYPFALIPKGTSISADINNVLYAAKPTADGLGVDYDFSNGRTVAHKTFRFQRDSYLTEVTTTLTDTGRPVPHLIAWRGGFGDETVANAPTIQHTLHYDLGNGKLVINDVKAAKNGTISSQGTYSFAGVEDTFFAGVFLPQNGKTIEIQTLSDAIPTVADPSKTENRIGAAVGGDPENQFALFVGPKDVDVLRRVDPKLEKIVDFGEWIGVLAKPLFIALNYVNDKFVHNYGWSIVVITVLLNVLLLPLRFTTMKSMKKMQAIQPQIQAINEKYKNIGMRDPRKAEQNQEVMALYQKHGINPMGGCLPMIPQFIILIAFYRVLNIAIEMRGAQWLWVTDLSQPEHLAIRLLPLLMVATQIGVQKMTPTTGGDPTQQKMMMLMPLMMLFFFYGASSGLVLYWLTSNIVGLIQQYFFNKAFHVGAVPASATVVNATPKKPKSR
jgi:YidC/Oxa1 family membrane protein insertase